MEIMKLKTGDTLQIRLIGRLDTTTAPSLETELNEELPALKELIFDLKGLEYISSAGLRVFLLAQKKINREGKKMIVRNVQEEVLNVFRFTGFAEFLTIE